MESCTLQAGFPKLDLILATLFGGGERGVLAVLEW